MSQYVSVCSGASPMVQMSHPSLLCLVFKRQTTSAKAVKAKQTAIKGTFRHSQALRLTGQVMSHTKFPCLSSCELASI